MNLRFFFLALGAVGADAGWSQSELDLDSLDSTDVHALLEEREASIGLVHIQVENVFDLTNPQEDKRLYRAANRFHLTTRENVVQSILLFGPGDPFSQQVLAESERLLRRRPFVADAHIRLLRYREAENAVDVEVYVRDAWSFSPEMKLSRSGGENEYGVGLSESNLLGMGKDLTVSYVSEVDRDETFVRYVDPNVRGGRTRLELLSSKNSDGDRHLIGAERPFYAFDTRWAVGGIVVDEQRIDTMYDLGEEIDEFAHDRRFLEVRGGWSKGLIDGKARRWLVGFAYDESRFAPSLDVPAPLLLPPDRKLVYPWIGFQLVEDDFRQMTQLNDMGRVEDVPLGLDLFLQLGFASEQLGSDRDAVLFRSAAHKGWEPGEGRLVLFDAGGSARWEDDGIHNASIQVGARYFQRNLGGHLFTVSLHALSTRELDPEHQVLLGGDTGLRGYPLRYQSGRHRAVLTVEQRFFMDWYPFRLFRVGSAVFFDAGRTWGEDPRATPSRGMLYDVGVGLRLSSPRSSGRSVVHIDLAFPLNGDASIDDVQLTVESKASF